MQQVGRFSCELCRKMLETESWYFIIVILLNISGKKKRNFSWSFIYPGHTSLLFFCLNRAWNKKLFISYVCPSHPNLIFVKNFGKNLSFVLSFKEYSNHNSFLATIINLPRQGRKMTSDMSVRHMYGEGFLRWNAGVPSRSFLASS